MMVAEKSSCLTGCIVSNPNLRQTTRQGLRYSSSQPLFYLQVKKVAWLWIIPFLLDNFQSFFHRMCALHSAKVPDIITAVALGCSLFLGLRLMSLRTEL